LSRKSAIDGYCHSVDKALELPKHHRCQLLAGLKCELKERFPLTVNPTEAQLYAEIGEPFKVAKALAESVPEEEQTRYLKRKRSMIRMTLLILSVLIVLALGIAGYLFANGGVVTIETTHYADGIPEGFPIAGEHEFTVKHYD